MSDIDLTAIRERAAAYASHRTLYNTSHQPGVVGAAHASAADVPALLAQLAAVTADRDVAWRCALRWRERAEAMEGEAQ